MPLAAPTTIAIFFSSVNAGSIMTASSRHSVLYAHPSRRGDERDAANARTLRVFEYHEAARLRLARWTPPGRLRRAQHRGLRLRRGQERRHRAAGSGAEPQRLQLARLR